MIGAPIVSLLSELPAVDEQNNENREEGLEKLKAIKSALHVMKNAEIKRQLNSCPANLNIILNYVLAINSSREEVSICVDILSTCVEALDGDALFSAFGGNLSSGLLSNDDEVTLLCIKTVKNILTRGKISISSIYSDKELFAALIKCVERSLEVANKSCSTIKMILTNHKRLTEARMWNYVEQEFQKYLDDDVIKIRVQELLVDCCCESEECFKSISTWTMFEEIITDSISDDILIQLNTFMILSNLASCEHGFEYLQQKNVFKTFSDLLINVDSHPFSSVVLPGLLKFFGGVCQHKPDQVMSQHPEFLTKLFTQMSLGDTLALETVGFIARGSSGKRILNSQKERFHSICLHLAGSLCHSTDTNQRVSGMFVAADLFHTDPKDAENNEISTITKEWWMNLGLTWNYLLEQLYKPFEDVKIGIHLLLANLLPYHEWVLRSFNNSAGFMEYLLGRQTEVGRGVALSKYDLICKLADSGKAREVFGDRTYVKLQAYKSNGPYYSGITDPQVAIEQD